MSYYANSYAKHVKCFSFILYLFLFHSQNIVFRRFFVVIWKITLQFLFRCFHARIWNLWLWCVIFKGHITDLLTKVYIQDLHNCQSCTKYKVQGHLSWYQRTREGESQSHGCMIDGWMDVIAIPSFCFNGNKDMKVELLTHCIIQLMSYICNINIMSLVHNVL